MQSCCCHCLGTTVDAAWLASLDLCLCTALAITYQFDAVQHQRQRLARKEKTRPFGVILMRSQVFYRACPGQRLAIQTDGCSLTVPKIHHSCWGVCESAWLLLGIQSRNSACHLACTAHAP